MQTQYYDHSLNQKSKKRMKEEAVKEDRGEQEEEKERTKSRNWDDRKDITQLCIRH